MRVAVERGLTHLAITDHERIEGALRARDAAGDRLEVIVGEEVRTTEGDLLGLYLEQRIEPGRPMLETIAAIQAAGGLAGIPHPFDRFRASGLARLPEERLEEVLATVDFIEAFNGRVPYPGGNVRAAELAASRGLPGVASSDAHTLLEVGVAYTILPAPVTDAASLRAAIAGVELITGRGSFVARAAMPFVKALQATRGVRPDRARRPT